MADKVEKNIEKGEMRDINIQKHTKSGEFLGEEGKRDVKIEKK